MMGFEIILSSPVWLTQGNKRWAESAWVILKGVISTSFVSTNGSIWDKIISAFKTPIGKSIAYPISWGDNLRITHPESLLNTILTGMVINIDAAYIGSFGSNILTPYSWRDGLFMEWASHFFPPTSTQGGSAKVHFHSYTVIITFPNCFTDLEHPTQTQPEVTPPRPARV